MSSQRRNLSSNAPWESQVGYSRAVIVGNSIELSGTVAVENGEVVAVGDAHQQTMFILKKIESVLQQAGFSLHEVVRTRMFVTDIDQWELVGRAHGTFFKDIRPATTMVEVSRLIHPDYLVEIEASAVKAQTS